MSYHIGGYCTKFVNGRLLVWIVQLFVKTFREQCQASKSRNLHGVVAPHEFVLLSHWVYQLLL